MINKIKIPVKDAIAKIKKQFEDGENISQQGFDIINKYNRVVKGIPEVTTSSFINAHQFWVQNTSAIFDEIFYDDNYKQKFIYASDPKYDRRVYEKVDPLTNEHLAFQLAYLLDLSENIKNLTYQPEQTDFKVVIPPPPGVNNEKQSKEDSSYSASHKKELDLEKLTLGIIFNNLKPVQLVAIGGFLISIFLGGYGIGTWYKSFESKSTLNNLTTLNNTLKLENINYKNTFKSLKALGDTVNVYTLDSIMTGNNINKLIK